MISLKDMFTLSLLLVLTPMTAVHAGKIFKWTDSEGSVHYGTNPPAGQKVEIVTITKGTLNPPSPPQPATAAKDEGTSDNGEKGSLSEQMKTNCEIAKMNLQTYKTSRSLSQPDGSIKEISEETQQQKIKEMEEAVSAYCK